MKLIYRGHIYEYTPRPVGSYIKPRAINWRYQLTGERFKCTPRPIRPYIKPRAINWRYQLPEMMPSH
ncbi:hypothetical protein ACE1CI_21160 [Aerosakkonemataceae cyanobacterium BLCC-F50]|uniref:DUF4278 domain-containing protein n=1 Tax=Floridaenema flaviceps BLCC-F50 TaxID=3153642 RepID=A0ABV4XUN1_9CYAN